MGDLFFIVNAIVENGTFTNCIRDVLTFAGH